ncbi:MAG: M28 family peptidase [Planctomycetes bacterium]|nr:M28 family peptidase [Planctomycetota bacterium]
MQDRIQALVDFLCSPTCAGRAPGTPGAAAARARIVAELEAAGVEPAGEDGWLQEVPGCGHNVVARAPGSGPLADRAIIVGAHYDHLGPAAHGQAYWGADDNAAAVAILVEVARALGRGPVEGRQVLLAFFDGEEPPHFLTGTMGSMRWVRRPAVPLERIDQMVCLDLVGHAIGPAGLPDAVRRTLLVLGAERSQGTAALVDACAARARGVTPRRLALEVIPPLSDYLSFEEVGVASLFLTCGRWEHYHQVTDTPDRLDYPKVAATADFLIDLTRALAARPDAPVRHDPARRDDLATIRTLLELGRLLAPAVPPVGAALAPLEALEARAGRGPLGAADLVQLRILVGQLESVLA